MFIYKDANQSRGNVYAMCVYIMYANVCDFGVLKHKKIPHKINLPEKTDHKLFHSKQMWIKMLGLWLVLRCVALILANVVAIFLAAAHRIENPSLTSTLWSKPGMSCLSISSPWMALTLFCIHMYCLTEGLKAL